GDLPANYLSGDAPKQVYRMTDRQAARVSIAQREKYAKESLAPRFAAPGRRWYADNSREPIRDETLRDGLIRVGAVMLRPGVATTSGKPRYALGSSFAALFAPDLSGEDLADAVSRWQQGNLTPGARARIEILRQGVVAGDEGVLVTFPNGETRRMAAGPSSLIAKAVVEQFAPRYLIRPGVLWLSESQTKVVLRDDALASRIGLSIDPQRNLPDLILVDVGPPEPLLVFVEVVATDGPVTSARRQALLDIATTAGFRPEQIAFVTAYWDRSLAAFKKTVEALSWQSFAWFASEPDQIIMLRDSTAHPARLVDLLR
ncbi:MAG: BsuBI/PstI family type II restriction endonuclease, partial [Vicinamibacterales bacterium]